MGKKYQSSYDSSNQDNDSDPEAYPLLLAGSSSGLDSPVELDVPLLHIRIDGIRLLLNVHNSNFLRFHHDVHLVEQLGKFGNSPLYFFDILVSLLDLSKGGSSLTMPVGSQRLLG